MTYLDKFIYKIWLKTFSYIIYYYKKCFSELSSVFTNEIPCLQWYDKTQYYSFKTMKNRPKQFCFTSFLKFSRYNDSTVRVLLF